MKEENKNKDIYMSIPELAVCKTRESQHYKSKAVETPDKSTRGWCVVNTRWVTAEMPEFCGRQLPFIRAFTLIELLVVVLIIGILAAIAIPQYEKAMWKTRNAQLKAVVRTVAAAEQSYYMANGKYAANFNELAIDLPLSAPKTQGTEKSYSTASNVCRFATVGSDAIRRGDGFDIILNATNLSGLSIVAVWTEGKYKCGGFIASPTTNRFYCWEARNGTATFKSGELCNKLEGSRDISPSNGHYTL